MSIKNKKLYWIKESIDSDKCPLCNAILDSCHIGVYCSNNKCGYVDGVAWLTNKQSEKHKDKILGLYTVHKDLIQLNKKI